MKVWIWTWKWNLTFNCWRYSPKHPESRKFVNFTLHYWFVCLNQDNTKYLQIKYDVLYLKKTIIFNNINNQPLNLWLRRILVPYTSLVQIFRSIFRILRAFLVLRSSLNMEYQQNNMVNEYEVPKKRITDYK